ncbi:exodeoxyribonuclease III [Rhodoferax antarcticus]|uniref:Exodeoxyribonuclease III n=1 Tax=Rhodoferax antarcticus ANT.BR TaxID=1111071 RepID=A0A1Q8YA54_9BURK|nr:exodeoxyribonuclease III [Rhodoferax antarcticus]APW46982.1 exodeoxyribonuclease III [Rhodoferax antarcticus]OLP04837.1 exodeoxyribonuclease III [Rhodoferax antarcticus ANT.BR]
MKLATWNVNSLTVRLAHVLDWLAANPVDVLALQELKLTDDKFPHAAFAQAGYSCQCFGQKTYNGVALISRTPAWAVVKNIPGFDDDMARVISATFTLSTAPAEYSANESSLRNLNKGLRVICAYFPNGQEPGSDKFEYKLAWLDGLRAWLRTELQTYPNLVLMGDYNITFDDADVWDPEGMRDQIHCTDEERYHLQALITLGLVDAHRLFAQPPKSYSWWDYRDMAFRRNRGMRIDHILVSNALKTLVTACHIDKTPRKNERPSDHAPVVVDLQDPPRA